MRPSDYKCPSCGSRWVDHHGLKTTCEHLQMVRKCLYEVHRMAVEHRKARERIMPTALARMVKNTLIKTERLAPMPRGVA